MSTTKWINSIKEAEKTALIKDGVFKVHYKFPDGREMAEEYNLSANVLQRRAWKKNSEIRKQGEWEIEVGDPETQNFVKSMIENVGIKESSDSPYCIRRVTKKSIEWRIRNLPYPIETYSVTSDQEQRCIIVRTTNKKYFKKLPVPELERVGLVPQQESIEFTHKFNMLIITYKKPDEVIQMEHEVMAILKTLKPIKDGDLECKPS